MSVRDETYWRMLGDEFGWTMTGWDHAPQCATYTIAGTERNFSVTESVAKAFDKLLNARARQLHAAPTPPAVADGVVEVTDDFIRLLRFLAVNWTAESDVRGGEAVHKAARLLSALAALPAPGPVEAKDGETVRVGASLLRKVNEPLPPGCFCEPGKCMAPKIMGRQMPCRDPQKAAAPERATQGDSHE